MAGRRTSASSKADPKNNGVAPGSFEARVVAREVDLIGLIRDGIPPIDYLPQSEGMLIRGKRHLIAAPRKEGKSLAMLVHWTRMALAGGRIRVFDRENGKAEYARRLDDIGQAWGLSSRHKATIRSNLHYHEFPSLRPADGPLLVGLCAKDDVVVFDSQRMFLTDFDLKESDSDDYSAFMAYAIDPLFQAGIATVILDNTGHTEQSRARGASAKGDLNEVLFTLKTEKDFSRTRQGKVTLKLAPGDSRFGNEGEWAMHLGGGAFSEWQLAGSEAEEQRKVDPAFRKAAEDALQAAGIGGLSQTRLLRAIREGGVKFDTNLGRAWTYELADDPAVPGVELVRVGDASSRAVFVGGTAR